MLHNFAHGALVALSRRASKNRLELLSPDRHLSLSSLLAGVEGGLVRSVLPLPGCLNNDAVKLPSSAPGVDFFT